MSTTSTSDLVRLLYRAATGKEPVAGDDWSKFCDVAIKCIAEARRGAIIEAHAAIYAYQPIDPQDMQAAYRRGYEATKTAVASLVLDLNREPKP